MISGTVSVFEHAVARYIENRNILRKDGRYLVALSGGADSVALLRVLTALGYQTEAVHCNFRLRGTEADRDEVFCQRLCASMDIPFHRVHFDTRTFARQHRLSIEMAARKLRYRYFDELRKSIGADGICVGHHRNDSAETVLMHLLRGTGLKGLAGIVPVQGRILRPLLCVNRCDIELYLLALHQDFVTDSTNLVDDVLRNRLRLDVMPLLEKIYPGASDHIARTAEYVEMALRIVNRHLDSYVSRKGDILLYLPQEPGDSTQAQASADIAVKSIRDYPSPELLLFTLVHLYGFSGAQAEEIFASLGHQGKMWRSGSHELLLDRGRILIQPLPDDGTGTLLLIPETGTFVLSDASRLQVTFGPPEVSRDRDVASLDGDKVHFPLTLRRCREGDRFVPFGMEGSRLLSDFLTDLKRSRFEKHRQWVVTEASGAIVWVVGERTDNRFRLSADSKRALLLRRLP